MYGVENVNCILSTYFSWRFFTWAADEDESADGSKAAAAKSQLEGCDKAARKSPPMSSPNPYCDSGHAEEDKDEDVDMLDSTTVKYHEISCMRLPLYQQMDHRL